MGRKPQPPLGAPPTLFDAQVGKVRTTAGHVVEGHRRVVCGGPRRFVKQVGLQQRRETIPTACMARWDSP